MLVEISGGCHCGNIAYSAQANPQDVRICHCNDCQVLSGSAFRVNLPVDANTFTLLSGELKHYIKVAESGRQRYQCFCENCGTQIYATSVDERREGQINIRVGTIKQREKLIPHYQQFVEASMPWVESIREIVKQ